LIPDDPYFNPARVQKLNIEPGRRILVISDIHANLPYLKGVLAKAGFCDDDVLIIDGDYLEKGCDSIGTLKYLMQLCERGNVHVINGNCDGWARFFVRGNQVRDDYIKSYLRRFRYGILYELLTGLGAVPEEIEDLDEWKDAVYEAFPEGFDFIATRPHAIETEHLVFVHAGRFPDRRLEDCNAGELYHFDNFRSKGYAFDKWTIVGHWPLVLYGTDRVCANPIIDRDRRIISIDGGCVLKDDGQLNCLILPSEDSDDFS